MNRGQTYLHELMHLDSLVSRPPGHRFGVEGWRDTVGFVLTWPLCLVVFSNNATLFPKTANEV